MNCWIPSLTSRRSHCTSATSNFAPTRPTPLRRGWQRRQCGPWVMGPPKSRQKPLSDEEVGHRIAALRRELEGRWDACQDYLASIAWPALRFRITNRAQSFLTNVQVILTFHGAAGVEFTSPEEFEWERLKDPDWEPPAGPYGVIAHSPGAGCSPGSARRNLRGRRVRRAQAFISPS